VTEKQRLFALEYLKDFNATRAYMEVYDGCNSTSAGANGGSRLLRNSKVKAFLDENIVALESEKIADANEILERLSSIARGEQKEEVAINCGGGIQKIIERTVGIKDQMRAAELLGKANRMFGDSSCVNDTVVIFENENNIRD